MLQAFRRGAKSWLAKGLMITLAAAFGLWGINDIFRGATAGDAVASVGDFDVSSTDYDRELRATLRNQNERMHTEMTMEEARRLGLPQMVLDRMMDRAAMDVQVKKLGLTVNDEAVVATIRSMPQFQAQGGTFSRIMLQEALRQNGMTEQAFEASVRQDMTRTQLIGSTINWFDIPPSMSRLLFSYLNQNRVAEYVVLTPELAGNVPAPGEAEITAYYKANTARFSTPEYRELQYVTIGIEQFSAKVEVAEADLKKEYDTHKETYVKPEQRDIEQINFPSKETADAAHDKIKSGGDFVSVARGMGFSDTDLKLGTFPKSGLDPRLANAAFAVPEGGVTAPVQGPFGWVILRVTKVTPGLDKTFEELREPLRLQLAKGLAMVKMIEAVNAFEDARAGGAALDEAAKSIGLPIVHIAAVDKNGLAPDGSKANLPTAPAFMQQAFGAEAGEEGDIFQSDEEHAYAIKIVGVRPPAPKPLEQVREQVVKEWTETERAKLLAARAKALTEQASNSGSLGPVAQALGRQPATSAPLRRDSVNDIFSANVLRQLFATPPGRAIYGPLGKGAGYVIARTINVKNPDPSADIGGYQNNRRQVAQTVMNDLVQSFAASARAVEGATIHEKTYTRIAGGSQ